MLTRRLRCKKYHESRGKADEGRLRTVREKKSRCPGWAKDERLRRVLLADAVEEPEVARDMFGNPKRIWNAVADWTFVGVSTNEQEPSYNCYPEVPATSLIDELAARAERSVEQLLDLENGDGPV